MSVETATTTRSPFLGTKRPRPKEETPFLVTRNGSAATVTVTCATTIVLEGSGTVQLLSTLQGTIEAQGFPMTATTATTSPIHRVIEFCTTLCTWASISNIRQHGFTLSECQKGDVILVNSSTGNSSLEPSFTIHSDGISNNDMPCPLDTTVATTVYPPSWKTAVAEIVKDVKASTTVQTSNEGETKSLDESNAYANSAFFNDAESSDSETDEIQPKEDDVQKIVVTFCGSKNVGKSTCLHYCTNQLLAIFDEEDQIAILDADPGQPLCCTVGQLRLSLVQSPRSSTTSTTPSSKNNGTQPLRTLYFGSVTSQTDPTSYLKCIQNLMDRFHNDCSASVLLVNLDGWVKGLGKEILTTLLQNILRPDHVVELGVDTSTDTPSAVDMECRLYACAPYNDTETKKGGNKDVVSTDNAAAVVLKKPPPYVPSAVLRSLRLVSYFLGSKDDHHSWKESITVTSGGVSDPNCVIAQHFASLCPLMVPLDKVEIRFCSRDDHNTLLSEEAKIMALQGSVVGLCHSGDTMDACLLPCVGLGIVRAVDRVKRLLFVLTPVEQLDASVSVLTLGSTVHLPMECYFRGVYSSSFPFLAVEDTSDLDLVGAEIMKSRNGIGRRGLNGPAKP